MNARLWTKLRTEPHPFRWTWSRFLHRTGLGRFLSIDRGLYRVRFFPTAISLLAYVEPDHLREEEVFVRRHVGPGDMVVDVGSNVGLVTLSAAALVGLSGRVFSFEANPRIFEYLKKNVRINRFANVEMFNVALGESPGFVCISDFPQDDYNHVGAHGKRVPLVRLDDALRAHTGRMALLKLDVEGYEKFVLQGAGETLARTDCVFFEVCEEHFAKYHYGVSDVLELLSQSGFCFYQMHGDGAESPVEFGYTPNGCRDLIARRTARSPSAGRIVA